MKKLVFLTLVAGLLCAPQASVAAETAPRAEVSESVASSVMTEPCCFTNPRFTGVCQVTPGGDETCASILGYLNNPNSVGRAYCGNTKVRGGWAQVDCEGSAATAAEIICRAGAQQE
jgi:hypothetical protein